MRGLLLVFLVAGCATAEGPKRPDEAHRVPVNRTAPPEAGGAGTTNRAGSEKREARRSGELEWR